jgi:hypothetical protein
MDSFHLKPIQRSKHQCHYQEQDITIQRMLGTETLMLWAIYVGILNFRPGTGILTTQVVLNKNPQLKVRGI